MVQNDYRPARGIAGEKSPSTDMISTEILELGQQLSGKSG